MTTFVPAPYATPDLGADFNLPLFKTDFMLEYIRTNRFNKYIGTDGSMPIQLVMELKKGGENIRMPFMSRLKKRGVMGKMALAGREDKLDKFSHLLRVEQRRQGLTLSERDEHMTFAKAMGQMRPHLLKWSKEQFRDDIIDACFMVQPRVTMHVPLVNPDPTQVLAGDPPIVNIKRQATTAELNAWVTNNADRVVFGDDTGLTAGNFAANIGSVSSAADRAGAALIDRMKLKAELCDPHMTPIEVGEDGEEMWVVWCDALTFEQYRKDPEIKEFNLHARAREAGGYKRNPMITGGDLEWNGCVIRKIQEMGTHSATVGRSILVGAEAIGAGIGADPDFRERKEDDYGEVIGVGIKEIVGVEKLQLNDSAAPTKFVDHGSVTGFSFLS